jgi:hypothetical protein
MSRIEIVGLAQAVNTLRVAPKQARFAGSVALNHGLRAAAAAERAAMARSFDRPTPYLVRNGVGITLSDHRRAGPLEGQVHVVSEGPGAPGKALRAEVKGGPRRAKRSELLLRRLGVLPATHLTVPGRAARLDAYGNITRGQILEVLAWFQAFPERGTGGAKSWRDNITDKGKARKRAGNRNRSGYEYFAIKPGDKKTRLVPGIYRRDLGGARFMGPVGTRPQAVLVFVPRTQYTQRLQFVEEAQRALLAELPAAFTRALSRALETAR